MDRGGGSKGEKVRDKRGRCAPACGGPRAWMSERILKWFTIMEAGEGVGQKMLRGGNGGEGGRRGVLSLLARGAPPPGGAALPLSLAPAFHPITRARTCSS